MWRADLSYICLDFLLQELGWGGVGRCGISNLHVVDGSTVAKNTTDKLQWNKNIQTKEDREGETETFP